MFCGISAVIFVAKTHIEVFDCVICYINSWQMACLLNYLISVPTSVIFSQGAKCGGPRT